MAKESTAVAQREQRAVSTETQSFLEMIERIARDPSVDTAKMKDLLAMQKDLMQMRAEQLFNEAMGAAQSEIRPVVADSDNAHTKSRHASMTALDNALRPIYTKHGFAISFNTEPGAPENEIRIVCLVTHSGFTRKYQVDMPADGKGAQGKDVMTKTHATGAAMTYGQRYLLKLIFNIAVSKDDDGNGAEGVEFISEAQLKELRDGLDETNADIPHFCTWFKIDSLAEMPAKRFKEAQNAVAARKRNMGKAKK